MAYIRDFNSYKKFKKEEKVNEEILGAIFGFLKNLWNKATAELKKFGDNPSIEQVGDYIEQNPLNPKDDGFIFKNKLDEFNKLPEANEQACLDLVKDLIDPTVGILGTQGLQPLYDSLLKTFGKDTPTLEITKFIFEKIRNKAIKDYKYGGGPDLKPIPKKDAVIDPKKLINDMKDQTHLPDFKKVILAAGQDGKKRKQLAYDWVMKTLCPRLQAYQQQFEADANSEKELEAYLAGFGKKAPKKGPKEGYKAGETVIYKREKFVEAEWAKLTEEDKKKTDEGKMKELIDKEMIGVKALKADVKDTKNPEAPVQFEGFDKKVKDILGKVDAKAEGQEDLVKTLGEVKAKNPEAIKKVGDIAKLYQDPAANKDKIAEIEKAMGDEEAK